MQIFIPDSGNDDFRMGVLFILSVYFQSCHKKLLPERSSAVLSSFDAQVIARSQLSSSNLHSKRGKNEHDYDHQNCDEEDLLYPSKELNHDSTNVGNLNNFLLSIAIIYNPYQGIDSQRSHSSEDHQ